MQPAVSRIPKNEIDGIFVANPITIGKIQSVKTEALTPSSFALL